MFAQDRTNIQTQYPYLTLLSISEPGLSRFELDRMPRYALAPVLEDYCPQAAFAVVGVQDPEAFRQAIQAGEGLFDGENEDLLNTYAVVRGRFVRLSDYWAAGGDLALEIKLKPPRNGQVDTREILQAEEKLACGRLLNGLNIYQLYQEEQAGLESDLPTNYFLIEQLIILDDGVPMAQTVLPRLQYLLFDEYKVRVGALLLPCPPLELMLSCYGLYIEDVQRSFGLHGFAKEDGTYAAYTELALAETEARYQEDRIEPHLIPQTELDDLGQADLEELIDSLSADEVPRYFLRPSFQKPVEQRMAEILSGLPALQTQSELDSELAKAVAGETQGASDKLPLLEARLEALLDDSLEAFVTTLREGDDQTEKLALNLERLRGNSFEDIYQRTERLRATLNQETLLGTLTQCRFMMGCGFDPWPDPQIDFLVYNCEQTLFPEGPTQRGFGSLSFAELEAYGARVWGIEL